MDKGHVTLLVMLELSAAFDTVDDGIFLHRLQCKLGLRDKALLRFKSYLTEERSWSLLTERSLIN